MEYIKRVSTDIACPRNHILRLNPYQKPHVPVSQTTTTLFPGFVLFEGGGGFDFSFAEGSFARPVGKFSVYKNSFNVLPRVIGYVLNS